MDTATPEGKTNAWNEQAKYQLLLRILAQMKEGRTIKWDLVNLPGRTTKSLQNIWTKINKEIQELEAQCGGGGGGGGGGASGVATPKKSSAKKSGGRGRPKKSEVLVAEDAAVDDDEDIAPIPCKLATKNKRQSLLEDDVSDIKRMKTEDDVLLKSFKKEDSALESVLGEGDGEEC